MLERLGLDQKVIVARETRKPSAEMRFVGDQAVIDNLKAKHGMLKRNDPDHQRIKLGIIFPGGGHRAVYQAGFGSALVECGMGEVADICIGVSVGAITGYYLMAGETEKGATLIWDDDVENGVFTPWNLLKIMDIKKAEIGMRKKQVDQKFRRSRSHLITVMTDNITGKAVYGNTRMADDPILHLLASISHPVFNGNEPITILGREYIDGVIGDPLPISYAIGLGLTDILVVKTSPISGKRTFDGIVEKALDRYVYSRFNPGVRDSLQTYAQRYNNELGYLTGERAKPEGVNIAAIYPANSKVSKVTTDREVLQGAFYQAYQFANQLFGNL